MELNGNKTNSEQPPLLELYFDCIAEKVTVFYVYD